MSATPAYSGLPQFLRFCVVGGIAFIVDAGVLELLLALGIGPAFFARILSIAVAMQVAYVLNLTYTFRQPESHSMRTWGRFIASNIVGAIINYLTFLGVLYLLFSAAGMLERIIAIVVGTCAGLVFNYWANKRLVFTGGAND